MHQESPAKSRAKRRIAIVVAPAHSYPRSEPAALRWVVTGVRMLLFPGVSGWAGDTSKD